MTKVSKFAKQKAAQVWCKPSTEKITMIPELAEEIAKVIDEYCNALMWCSGSADFSEEGKARKGWLKICQPLIREAGK